MKQIKSKKGVELSLNIVVVGVILLIVLAIVLFIFGTQMNAQSNIINDLTTKTETSAKGEKGGILTQVLNCDNTKNPCADGYTCTDGSCVKNP